MKQRINEMAEAVKKGKVWFETTPVEYDRMDLLSEPLEMQAKRTYEYITKQVPQIDEKCALAGYLRFDGSVEGDIFGRAGHKYFGEMVKYFYCKPYHNLVTHEWQHSVGNFKKIIDIGIDGIKAEISKSKALHEGKEERLFLDGLDTVCDAIIAWANKCADYALEKSNETQIDEYKNNLEKLSKTLRKIPQKPAENFYEAVQCIYICYPFLPDSIGPIDRYLYGFYKAETEKNMLDKEDAKSYLQELFLMLQSRISIKSDRFYRGGESHFCIGGYLDDGSDGFNELSYLIVESLMELPTAIPQISIRRTDKTPIDVLKYTMDSERKDKYKRIAFVNDEPRIAGYTNILEFPYETAINYSMTGCNEPLIVGGTVAVNVKVNILRSVSNVFQKHENELVNYKTFDEFYTLFEQELISDLTEIVQINDLFTKYMARDTNMVSAILLDGCIENAKSPTNGGVKSSVPMMSFIGIANVIDSLAIVKQFIYDEKRTSMSMLIDALKNNWKGFEMLRTEIINVGKFFGNDDEETNNIAKKITTSIYNYLMTVRHIYGRRYAIGSIIGYNEHHKWFGDLTAATPDGRYDGNALSFGIGQSDGRDRKGLTALLNSVAVCDPNRVITGPSVTNVLLDEKLVSDDALFNKLVPLFDTYFRQGGTHFQLSYVSKEDLINAKKTPDKYKSLRVRVSGFSDFFVNLNDALQDEIITRTVKGGA